MLEVFRENLRQEPQDVQARVRIQHGDMRDFRLDQRYQLVTIPFRPFQHLISVDDQLACLNAIRRHLLPGGTLILDLFFPSLEALCKDNIGQELPEGPLFSTPDGRQVQRYAKIVGRDRFQQVNRVELIYQVTHPDGRSERVLHAFSMCYLFRYEVEHLLARAGFRIEEIFSDYDRSPFGSKYPGEMIVVAHID